MRCSCYGCVRTQKHWKQQKGWALLAFHPSVLDHQHQSGKRVHSLAEYLALVSKGNLLFHRGPDAEELAHFIKGTAEARCRGEVSKTTHGVIALFDATVVLLQPIVEIGVTPMHDLTAEGLANRTRIGIMPVRRHSLWSMTNGLEGLLEKALGGIQISLLTQTRIAPDCHLGQWLGKDNTMFHAL
jgi:hypothetical protein